MWGLEADKFNAMRLDLGTAVAEELTARGEMSDD
jgi:hypothetical protein